MKPRNIDLLDVLRTPYAFGGRTPGKGLDCLGVVLVIARRLGLPAPDPWDAIAVAWDSDHPSVASGFSDGWARQPDNMAWRTGDVLLFYGDHPWAAIVHEGRVWSADVGVGCVWAVPVSRWRRKAHEHWRFIA